ncbi:MAG: hypothetical protein JXR19_09035 [Bacteroidia bacterium]
MKKLIIHSVLFLLPLVLLLALVPVDRRILFKELKDDCLNKGIWMHDRIHINTTPIDIAFLGTSHTINAIDEKVIEANLSDSTLDVTNFGYCRIGRNLNLALLEEIGKKKTPQVVVLEIRENENLKGHPVAPYIVSSSSFLKWNSWFHSASLSDLWKHLSYKTQLTQDKYYNRIDSLHFFPWDHYHKSAIDTATDLTHSNKPIKKGIELKYTYPHSYLKQIAKWCSNRNVELVFIYLPNYSYRNAAPLHIDFYEEYGKVWLPPAELLNNNNLWYDIEHLNTAGAKKYSEWVASKLEE